MWSQPAKLCNLHAPARLNADELHPINSGVSSDYHLDPGMLWIIPCHCEIRPFFSIMHMITAPWPEGFDHEAVAETS